ncbi:hypothetical protein V7S43_005908 [Phytophthora oleae]|uniref:Uncharacterized protein n=1 Tax=Phytophthora oleae TaxID=2107226 RepID=A0ABD3FSC8_9STRA
MISDFPSKRKSVDESCNCNSNEDELSNELVDELNSANKRLSTDSTSKNLLEFSSVSNSTELGEIQQSVRRLRAQRTHVEHLTQRSEELEHHLAEEKAENEKLQREVFILRGAEQENVAYLQSMKLLEQRARELEEAYNAKIQELRSATARLNCVEQECDQLREEIRNTRQDHKDEIKLLREKQKKLVEQLEQSHEAHTDDRKRLECYWKHKMKSIARANSETIDSVQRQLEINCSRNGTEVRELEEQVKELLVTTVRQTTVIEDCDRVLSETKAQQQQSQRSYEEQRQLSRELSSKVQRLELQVAKLKQSKGLEKVELEKKVLLLENKLVTRKNQVKAAEEALKNKEKETEAMHASRDDSRLHLNELIKELQRIERNLKSEISELQITLRDANDERNLLSDQVVELQEKLENERKDRSQWATARLKLLADFCDEESKLSSALHHPNDFFCIDACWKSAQKLKQPTISAKNRKTHERRAIEDRNYDGDDSAKEDEPRRNSIVFG